MFEQEIVKDSSASAKINRGKRNINQLKDKRHFLKDKTAEEVRKKKKKSNHDRNCN